MHVKLPCQLNSRTFLFIQVIFFMLVFMVLFYWKSNFNPFVTCLPLENEKLESTDPERNPDTYKHPKKEIETPSGPCSFYETKVKETHFEGQSPYPRAAFASHLIDLVYAENRAQGLYLSEGWNRTKRIMDNCKVHGAVLFSSTDWLFFAPTEYIANWFRDYGCASVLVTDAFDASLVGQRSWTAVGIHLPEESSFEHLIIVQTEQMTATTWVEILRPRLLKCQSTASCAIWEFSESNYLHSISNYKTRLPTIILPITLRNKPTVPRIPTLQERSHGFIFYGYTNERRQKVIDGLKKVFPRWEEGQGQDGYLQSKFCISVHFYGEDSGIELHRLAQHVKMGCLPVYETPGDTMPVEFFNHHKSLLFVQHQDFVEKVKEMNGCIESHPELMKEQQEFVMNWWSRELEAFEKVLKALFYEYSS